MADEAKSGIYEIVNIASGKRYVGRAVDIERRWYMHRWALSRGRHHSRRLQAAWAKHGPTAFEFRILEHCARGELTDREQYHFGLLLPVYNIAQTAGGGGGILSAAGRTKIAESNRRRAGWKQSAGSKAMIAEANAGNTATKGRPRCRNAVERTAACHRGMKRSAETVARISAAMTGKKRGPRTFEHRAKLSAAMKLRSPNPEAIAKMRATKLGSKLSDEHRARIGEASRLAWARRKAAANAAN